MQFMVVKCRRPLSKHNVGRFFCCCRAAALTQKSHEKQCFIFQKITFFSTFASDYFRLKTDTLAEWLRR